MAAGDGQNAPHLIDDLIARIPEYDFFQAVYLAEVLTRERHLGRKDFGFDQKGLQFRPYEKYSYPPTDIRACQWKGDSLEFVLNFMGLYGINSPLPRCYHEQIVQHQYAHERGNIPLQNFLDIFNNRFYWLYFLAWKKYRYYLHLSEEPQGEEARRAFAFLGKGAGWAPEENVDPLFMLQFSGIFAHRVRNRSGLQILITEFFRGMAVTVQEFIPQKVKFGSLPLLGRKAGERGSRLGVTSVVGRSTVDYAGRIAIALGPLSFGEYTGFLPGGVNAGKLFKLLRWYLHDNLFCDVEVLIRCPSIVPVALGNRDTRLGMTAWLGRPGKEVVTAYYPSERYA